jgi:hypothetical protein
MKTIVTTYPGFHSLPRGIKQMLVISESLFFAEARPAISRPGAIRSKLEDYLRQLQPENRTVNARGNFG